MFRLTFLSVAALSLVAHLAGQQLVSPDSNIIDRITGASVPLPPGRGFAVVDNHRTTDWLDRMETQRHPADKPASGTVSVARLERPISARALREFARSEREMRKGKVQASIAHLEKAIQSEPSYMEAHNNLGIRYMMLTQYDRAVTQFEKAIDLDASSVFAQANLSLARYTLQQFPEAEAAARAALRMDRNFAKAHYLLGLTLAAQDKDLPDAIDHLDKAAHEFPGASLLAARCLAQRGLTAGR